MEPPSISVNDQELEVVHEFIYLGSTITDNLSLDSEHSRRIGNAATTLSRLTKRVWNNTKLTEHTNVQVYKACVLSMLSSETWTQRSCQERRLSSFHMRCLRRILGTSWKDRVSNSAILERAGHHVHTPETEAPSVVGSCLSHGGWIDSQGPSLCRAGVRKTTNRSPSTALQRYLQARPEGPEPKHQPGKHQLPTDAHGGRSSARVFLVLRKACRSRQRRTELAERYDKLQVQQLPPPSSATSATGTATPVWASTVIAGAALTPTKTTKGADTWSPETEGCLQACTCTCTCMYVVHCTCTCTCVCTCTRTVHTCTYSDHSSSHLDPSVHANIQGGPH